VAEFGFILIGQSSMPKRTYRIQHSGVFTSAGRGYPVPAFEIKANSSVGEKEMDGVSRTPLICVVRRGAGSQRVRFRHIRGDRLLLKRFNSGNIRR